MKKFAGCVIKENTITLTKAFAKLAYTPGTAEFRYLAELHKAFPDFPIVQRTAKPNDDKEKHGGLTISRMEFIIKNYIGDEIALAEFKEVQKFYKGLNGYHGKVKGWFLKKYPNYTAHILDGIIDKVVRQIFERMKAIPKSEIVNIR